MQKVKRSEGKGGQTERERRGGKRLKFRPI
jgi:hypothetical protein